MKREPTVFIVDDDPAVRESLDCLFEANHLDSETYSSAHEFLEAFDADRPGCLLLDLRMPWMDGLELQQRLAELPLQPPIIFLTAHGDVRAVVASMKLGAVDFLQKPYNAGELVAKVLQAIERDAQIREDYASESETNGRLASLTPREREVLGLIVSGRPTKNIAKTLGSTFNTVKNQRTSIMRKMKADSVADLVRMVTTLRVSPDA